MWSFQRCGAMLAHMSNTDTITDAKLMARIDALAARMHVSRDEIIKTAVASYLDGQESFIASVEAGLEQAKRGDFASPDEVDRVFGKYGSD